MRRVQAFCLFLLVPFFGISLYAYDESTENGGKLASQTSDSSFEIGLGENPKHDQVKRQIRIRGVDRDTRIGAVAPYDDRYRVGFELEIGPFHMIPFVDYIDMSLVDFNNMDIQVFLERIEKLVGKDLWNTRTPKIVSEQRLESHA